MTPRDVTAEPTEAVPSRLRSDGRTLTARFDRTSMWVAGVAGAQAVWLATWMSRGWFYQDDITFLAQATDRSLGLAYLTDPVNDHLTPGLRLAFWILRPLGLEHYWVSIGIRVALQVLATVLLARLLITLVGDRRLVRWVVGGYAFSPLLLGPLWLSCAMNVLPAQVLVILGITAHVRYTRGGRLRSAAWAGIAFLLAAMFWELSAVDLLLLPLLSLGFLHEGPIRERLRATLMRWPGWALILSPTAVFAIAYAAAGYGGSARSVGLETVLGAWWREWVQTVAPLSVGGPWRWASFSNVYFSATATPIAAMGIVQAVFVGAVVVSVHRTGWTALAAWAMPVVNVLVTATIVVIGRYHEFGFVSMREITYAFDAAIPLAIAVCLGFLGAARTDTPPADRSRPRESRRVAAPIAALAGGLAIVLLGGAAVSAHRFSTRWQQNPTEPYVNALRQDLAARPGVSLFDTPLPTSLVPYFQPNRYLSDLLPLLGVSARSANNGPNPLIVNGQGRVVDAVFLPAAQAVIPPDPFCGDLFRGPVDRTHALVERPSTNEWFLKIDYFQQQPTIVYVKIIDSAGHEVAPISGSRVVLDGTLATQYLRFPKTAPIAVQIRTSTNGANLCVTGVAVGYPFPKPQK